jgi:hypothetical protein
MRKAVGVVHVEEPAQGSFRAGSMKHRVRDIADIEQCVCDEDRLDIGLTGEVLVEGRRLNVKVLGQSPHGERACPFILQNVAGRFDNFGNAGRARRRLLRTFDLARKETCFGRLRFSHHRSPRTPFHVS